MLPARCQWNSRDALSGRRGQGRTYARLRHDSGQLDATPGDDEDNRTIVVSTDLDAESGRGIRARIERRTMEGEQCPRQSKSSQAKRQLKKKAGPRDGRARHGPEASAADLARIMSDLDGSRQCRRRDAVHVRCGRDQDRNPLGAGHR